MSDTGPAPLDVAIVGAGIAGLSAAHTLLERGRARGVPVRLAIFDADDRAGGVIRTERIDGFVVEAGPDCFITDKPWALKLCERLGLADDLVGTNPACRRSFVLRGRRLLPIPDGFHLMAPARLMSFATTPTLSLRGRIRAAFDLVLPRGPVVPDESLASFVTRRFGAEVLERLAQPLLAGIYNADPERLSLRATMPRFLDLERDHRSVIAGLRRGRRGATGAGAGTSGARYSLFVAPRRGMGAIVERLLQAIPAEALHLQSRVIALRSESPQRGGPGGPRWMVSTGRGATQSFHAVVLALGAGQAAPLLRPLDGDLADRLAATPYGSSTTVSLGYRETDVRRALDGFGFVVPRLENRPLIACSFASVKFPDRAPDGGVLLRAFTSETLVPGRDEGRAIEAMRDQLREMLGITAVPLLARAWFHPASMAQYDVGHLDRVAEVESRLGRLPGLALAGNGLRGVGVPDCVRSGEAAADLVLSQAPLLVA
ncbi:MAG TPA: protoporphyrinogen oxidase [Patescibacteria group bacterium]|nr:protoporphyrinogen oxidase [Patescibacteria group bacterium]